jgi:hypothetical protein
MNTVLEARRILSHWRDTNHPVDLVVSVDGLGAAVHLLGWLLSDEGDEFVHGRDAVCRMRLLDSLSDADRIEISNEGGGTVVTVSYPECEVRVADHAPGEVIHHG